MPTKTDIPTYLDLDVLKDLFRDQRPLGERELLTLRLLTNEQGRRVPTKGAVLLVGKEREKHFPDAWVQCGRFIGRDKDFADAETLTATQSFVTLYAGLQ